MLSRTLIAEPVLPRGAERLGTGDKISLGLEIVGAYAVVRWRLLRSDLPTVVAACRRPAVGGRTPCADVPVATAIRLGGAVQRTLARVPLDSRCLIRSLVLTRMLERRGMTSRIVLAARTKPSFAAHAWVEYSGVAVLPTGSDYHRLTEL